MLANESIQFGRAPIARRIAVFRRYARSGTVRVEGVVGLPVLSGSLLGRILPAEVAGAHPGIHWDRLLFSAKESVYKAWYPLAHAYLEFGEARLRFAPEAGRFTARLLVPGPVVAGRRLDGFAGRWLVEDGLVITAIA